MTVNGEQKISFLQDEGIPMNMQRQCDSPKRLDDAKKKINNNKFLHSYKRYKLPKITLFCVVLMICITVLMIFMPFFTGFTYPETRDNSVIKNKYSILNSSLKKYRDKNISKSSILEANEFNSEQKSWHEYVTRSILTRINLQRRSKREMSNIKNVCKESMQYCMDVLDSLNTMMRILNESLPQIEELLRNLEKEEKRIENTQVYTIRDVLKCLKCTNGTEMNFNSKKNDISDNMRVVIALLNSGKNDKEMVKIENNVLNTSQKNDHKIDVTESSLSETSTTTINSIYSINVTTRTNLNQILTTNSSKVNKFKMTNVSPKEDIELRSNAFTDSDTKIISNTQITLPTAEVFQSSQQMELKPAVSWMQHPVCFYNPSVNIDQSDAQSMPTNQFLIPGSYPSPSYSVYQQLPQRQPFLPNLLDTKTPSPNVVQIQAQNIQFLPMRPSSNSRQWFDPGQKISPTESFKMPYYCTYMPAPTFQFPTVPGVQHRRTMEGYPKKTSNTCPLSSIQCDNGYQCVSKINWCDGHINCNDSSDEMRCTCRDRISKDRLCDGYFDCPDGEDELECFGCQEEFFSCGNKYEPRWMNKCIPLFQRCDGIKQCPFGTDELDCNILTPTYIKEKTIFPIGYAKGYLYRNLQGRWYPVCSKTISWAKEVCISEVGAEISRKNLPPIQSHVISPDDVYDGPYLMEVNGEVQITYSCENKTVYVKCPQIDCGTTILTEEDIYSNFDDEYKNTMYERVSISEDEKVLEQKGVQTNEKDLKKTSTSMENNEQNPIVGSDLRVVGGRQSKPKAWPSLVAIYRDGYFHCGGVILNEFWILTAAHCIEEYINYYYEILAGMLRRFSFSPTTQIRKARYIIKHPGYNRKIMKNDIGMIMLDNPLQFNRWVRPACLPHRNTAGAKWRLGPSVDSTCVTIGWGAIKEHGSDPDHLREVEVPILPHCTHFVDQNEAEICAGYPQGGRDACQGDSGGPLMCRNPYLPSQYYVAGIVSHGEGCARPNEPGAYTKVSRFVEWIKLNSEVQGVSFFSNIPLIKCPGFSCEGGLGKCLPVQKRCNKIVDCLEAEDELDCPIEREYELFRQSNTNVTYDLPDVTYSHDNFVASKTMDISTDSTTTKSETEYTMRTNMDASVYSSSVPFSIEFGSNINVEFSSTETNENIDTTPYYSTTTEPVTLIFTCAQFLQNIPFAKRCDKVLDCEDGTDEENCTCKDYLLKFRAEAICDGNIDCADNSDEENCGICPITKYFCKKSKICIPLANRCNGNFDCPLMEDEIDCFTLSNGEYVNMNIDRRPHLHVEGILTTYVNGEWRSTCHTPIKFGNASSLTLIGKNMCEYFGFIGALSVKEITVKNATLKSIVWSKNNTESYTNSPTWTNLSENSETCPGIYVRCRSILNSSMDMYITDNSKIENYIYSWPWLAAIFVDGFYHCSAILLEFDWILSSSACTENIRLLENYTTVLLGQSPSYLYTNGPFEQISVVDKIISLNSNASLLHLKTPMNMTHYVQPLFLEKRTFPPNSSDRCVAVGTDKNHITKSIFLQPILENCPLCHRCFINSTKIEECEDNIIPLDWSGTIFCLGTRGWYIAATFHEKNGSCNFQQFLTGIDFINSHLIHAMEEDVEQSLEPECNGIRCSIGRCIPWNQVCDGVQDCRNGADEEPENCYKAEERCSNYKNDCKCNKSEMRCNNGECISKNAFCNGTIDCTDGSDEPAKCTCANYLRLTNPKRLCDGIRHCLDKTDESPEICSCKHDSFKCNMNNTNEICIPQDFICDGDNDCPQGEDESECRKIKESPDYRVGTGEVMKRSYGIWHTECFPTSITSKEKILDICQNLGYTFGTSMNEYGGNEQPVVPHYDYFYIVRLNHKTWIRMRDDKPFITLLKSPEICNRLFVACI